MGLFARWPGNVDDVGGRGGVVVGFRMEFLFDGGEGAEQQAVDVGEDGGASRGDAVLGEQQEELGEDLVDVRGGLEANVSPTRSGARLAASRFCCWRWA